MAAKNIAIFLDGTWNAVDDYTNVYNLYQLCQGEEIDVDHDKRDWRKTVPAGDQQHAHPDQIRYYDIGVGTSITSPVLIGGAIGMGLKLNVAEAYLRVCQEYKPGDQIFIFGFSRGAYTARSLGGILNNFGMLKKQYLGTSAASLNPVTRFLKRKAELKIPRLAVSTYRLAGTAKTEEKKQRILNKFRKKYCTRETESTNCNGYAVPIKFMGIFDTVGSMGIPSLIDPLGNKLKKKSYRSTLERHLMPNAEFSGNVENAFHALAIDEFRPHFKPTLWVKTENKNVQQRWFVGAHSNVGGGYPDNLLNNKPMHWIYRNAKSYGLRMGDFNLPHQNVHVQEPIMDSFAGFRLIYKLTYYTEYYRPINPQDPSQSVDPSVVDRMNKDPFYRTPNLMALPKSDLNLLMALALVQDQETNQRIANLLDKATTAKQPGLTG